MDLIKKLYQKIEDQKFGNGNKSAEESMFKHLFFIFA